MLWLQVAAGVATLGICALMVAAFRRHDGVLWGFHSWTETPASDGTTDGGPGYAMGIILAPFMTAVIVFLGNLPVAILATLMKAGRSGVRTLLFIVEGIFLVPGCWIFVIHLVGAIKHLHGGGVDAAWFTATQLGTDVAYSLLPIAIICTALRKPVAAFFAPRPPAYVPNPAYGIYRPY